MLWTVCAKNRKYKHITYLLTNEELMDCFHYDIKANLHECVTLKTILWLNVGKSQIAWLCWASIGTQWLTLLGQRWQTTLANCFFFAHQPNVGPTGRPNVRPAGRTNVGPTCWANVRLIHVCWTNVRPISNNTLGQHSLPTLAHQRLLVLVQSVR